MHARQILAGALAALATGTVLAAAPAAAAAPARAANTEVTAWYHTGVHAQATDDSRRISYVTPNGSYSAICWTYGKNINLAGRTSNIWVKLDRTWPRENGYVSAIALTGDRYGGVRNKC
ncbi:SH3 domain-containing protein [Streptomyces sp. SCUT-3]|uniref:SH3 domain-containing protein n=1 Tax=Streptomyces TaxID=1883 RepID=UPI0015FAC654|nr:MULTISPECIES: SH3 domain-containing protein [unclassified Streptomyces]MCZ2526519.1 SH3 domain-containing protein [Streptomyces sp. HB2AG]QMV23946.1 SH3 domain-containing protein [Streptomyces sp. SCUT-3]